MEKLTGIIAGSLLALAFHSYYSTFPPAMAPLSCYGTSVLLRHLTPCYGTPLAAQVLREMLLGFAVYLYPSALSCHLYHVMSLDSEAVMEKGNDDGDASSSGGEREKRVREDLR
jgi:hypothetical protein